MITALALASLCVQSGQLGSSSVARIQAALGLLGNSRIKVQQKFGKQSASVQGDGVWMYGPWVPSPRLGFAVSFFREDDGEQVIDNGVQFVSASVASFTPKTLTVKGGRSVPNDFCWVSGESTRSVLNAIGASNVVYYAQVTNPNYVLTTCTVTGKPVYIFSRQIVGDEIVPAFAPNGSQDFNANRLDVYSIAVGYCSPWHYTAGYTEAKIVGPGSYEDTSQSGDHWTQLG